MASMEGVDMVCKCGFSISGSVLARVRVDFSNFSKNFVSNSWSSFCTAAMTSADAIYRTEEGV